MSKQEKKENFKRFGMAQLKKTFLCLSAQSLLEFSNFLSFICLKHAQQKMGILINKGQVNKKSDSKKNEKIQEKTTTQINFLDELNNPRPEDQEKLKNNQNKAHKKNSECQKNNFTQSIESVFFSVRDHLTDLILEFLEAKYNASFRKELGNKINF